MVGSMTVQAKFRVVVRAREAGGYAYQIFTVDSSEPSIRSENEIYATREAGTSRLSRRRPYRTIDIGIFRGVLHQGRFGSHPAR